MDVLCSPDAEAVAHHLLPGRAVAGAVDLDTDSISRSRPPPRVQLVLEHHVGMQKVLPLRSSPLSATRSHSNPSAVRQISPPSWGLAAPT